LRAAKEKYSGLFECDTQKDEKEDIPPPPPPTLLYVFTRLVASSRLDFICNFFRVNIFYLFIYFPASKKSTDTIMARHRGEGKKKKEKKISNGIDI